VTPRTRAALDQARQALADAARTEHDYRPGNRCPICDPQPEPTSEHRTDR
jgi:hypothetical protein